jgi:CobQ/CobB/MinD/ParA family nucleotide binding protein
MQQECKKSLDKEQANMLARELTTLQSFYQGNYDSHHNESEGGTGKSTIATNLAASFARDGAAVLLMDADPQRSALDWRADRPNTVPLVQVIGLPVENLHREIPPARVNMNSLSSMVGDALQ